MSIYATWLALDADNHTDADCPIVYQGSHVLPSDEDQRGGDLQVAVIPGFITAKDRPAVGSEMEGEETVHPWLRFTLNDQDVVLDQDQVEALRDTLSSWLAAVPNG